MPEHANVATVAPAAEASRLRIALARRRTSLSLKSWLPEHRKGLQPVMLAGRTLPSKVGTVLPGREQILCVGPAEWIIVSPDRETQHIREHLRLDPPGDGLVLVELTGGLAIIEVRGSAAREVLSKGCGLDLHPRAFGAGQCARTRFAQIPLLLVFLDEPSRFELYVARSYLDYLRSWLEDAAAEFLSIGDEQWTPP